MFKFFTLLSFLLMILAQPHESSFSHAQSIKNFSQLQINIQVNNQINIQNDSTPPYQVTATALPVANEHEEDHHESNSKHHCHVGHCAFPISVGLNLFFLNFEKEHPQFKPIQITLSGYVLKLLRPPIYLS